MSAKTLVELEDVHKTFYVRHFLQIDEDTHRRVLYRKRGVTAAKAISFQIKQGEIFGLLGPNGAGKTTAVKMISGLVRPDKGKVSVDGLHVETKRLQVLEKVGVVLEGTRTSIWPLTPLENLTYYGNLKNVRGRVLRKRAIELIEFIGLKDKMNIQVRRLSRGEKQKLAICIALIADPEVVLLDEPTTGLDVKSSRSIKDKIIEMTRDHDKCVLVTTHDMHVAQELCDRIAIINKGAMAACESTDKLLGVFSDQVYEFKLDRLPAHDELDGVTAVLWSKPEMAEDGPLLAVSIEPELASRSQALYATIQRLGERGYQLRSFSQCQQTLESVFLKLTSDQPEQPKG